MAWLVRHGASGESARCGMVTTPTYDLPFAYRDGDPATPSIGAGTALAAPSARSSPTAAPSCCMCGTRATSCSTSSKCSNGVALPIEPPPRCSTPCTSTTTVGGSWSIDTSLEVELLIHRRLPPARRRGRAAVLAERSAHRTAPRSRSRQPTSSRSGAPVNRSNSSCSRDGVDYDVVVLALPVGAHPYLCAELIAADARWRRWSRRSRRSTPRRASCGSTPTPRRSAARARR